MVFGPDGSLSRSPREIGNEHLTCCYLFLRLCVHFCVCVCVGRGD